MKPNFQLLLGATVMLSCSAGGGGQWQLDTNAPDRQWQAPPFVLLADTQYSIPATDYEVHYDFGGTPLNLTAAELAGRAGTFYRHSVANHVLLDALKSVLVYEKKQGRKYGVFAGDLIEFACRDEAEGIFEVLESNELEGLPFIIALGNHDVIFHGSYDLNAIGKDRRGSWDDYSLALWNTVCAAHGGPFDKAAMIQRILSYYRKAWGFEFPRLPEPLDGAPRVQKSAVENGRGWTLTYAVSLEAHNIARAHRTSTLWQRFAYSGEKRQSPVTLTVLDTTDYAERHALCELAVSLTQIGMSGSLSAAQVRWLDELRPPTGQHFVVSHYLPFSGVQNGDEPESACSLTVGTDCGWAKRVVWKFGENATFIYAHVHRPYDHQRLVYMNDDAKRALDLVRLPSLIDDKRYVTFDGKKFTEYELARNPKFQTEAPFSVQQDVCTQRFREYVELERNLACFSGAQSGPTQQGRCVALPDAERARQSEGQTLCRDRAVAWKRANPVLWQGFASGICKGAVEQEHWRCIVRGLGQAALAPLKGSAREQFARQQLRGVATLPRNQ